MKYIKLFENFSEDLSLVQPIIDLLKSGDPDNIELAAMQIESQKLQSYIYPKYNYLMTYCKCSLLELFMTETLDLSNRGLVSIPNTSAIADLVRLKNVNLNGNKLQKIPKEFFELSNLEIMSFGDNLIKEIPKEIKKLTKLLSLDLSDNQITKLPKELFTLPTLHLLNLENNLIKELPRQVGDMQSLTLLKVSDNNLSAIPKEISKLTNLMVLNISGNETDLVAPTYVKAGGIIPDSVTMYDY